MNHLLSRRAAGLAALVGLVALAAGCATQADVRADQEPGSDLKAYKTFAFYESPSPGYMSLAERHLRAAARAQLERQHYTYDDRAPDLRVNYALHVVDKQALKATPAAGRFGYRGWAGSGVESVEYRQGTLAIDLVDARRNALVWRAVAEGRVDAKAMEQPGPTIDAVVSELFTRFPGAAP
jgi:Domain of unknown function (DUF4136)